MASRRTDSQQQIETVVGRRLRHRKLVLSCLSALAMAALSTSCGNSSAGGAPHPATTTSTSPTSGVRSYMLEGANNVYWMQLKGDSQVEGIFEEVLGPGVTPDRQVHDYVYRLSGSLAGHAMSFHLESLGPDAPAFPTTLTGTVTSRAVTLGGPFTSAEGDVLTAANQHEYDIAARAHVEAWKNAG